MNKRIQQLATEAELELTIETKKFAELIVREMLVTCEEHPAWTGRMIGEQIKQHFGVEDRAIPILSADEEALLSGITSSKLFTIEAAKKAFGVEE